jgi:type I restriction enzyme S subunit
LRNDPREVALGQIADISIGRTPSRSDPSYWTLDLERPFCSIADIGPGRVIDPHREGVTEKAVLAGKAKRVPGGSLLMSFKLTIGRTGITARDVYPNEAIAWIKPHDENETSQEFLRIFLPTLDFDRHTGVAVKGKTLNLSSMNALPLQLPSISEQRRIADLIGALDEQVELSAQESARLSRLLDALRKRIIDLSRWSERPLSDFLRAIEGGRSPSSLERPPAPGERAVLKVSAVKPALFVPTEAKALAADTLMPDRALVQLGDVLITRANTAELVGAVCRVASPPDELYLSDKTLRLVFKEDVADPDFFVHALATPSVRQQISLVATGTSASMKNISQKKIEALTVRASSDVTEQRKAAGSLDEVLARVRRIDERTAALLSLRPVLLGVLLSGTHEIPDSYDRFLNGAAPPADFEQGSVGIGDVH